ncbi:MAG: UMP kinase [Promethearchaeota archaeon]
MAEHKIVLKIGGSMLFSEDLSLNLKEIEDFLTVIKNNHEKIQCVVVGGGKVARAYISALKTFNHNEAIQDLLGINVSRINAFLLAAIAGFDFAYQGVPTSIKELLEIKSANPDKIVFLGGLEVSQSTTSVACEAAEALNVKQIIVGTDVDGIYNKDPNKFNDAIKLNDVRLDEIMEILQINKAKNQSAGEYRILDAVSIGILKRSEITVQVIKASKDNFEKALNGQIVGTKINP